MKAVQQKWFVIVAMAFMLCLTGLIMTGEAQADRCLDNGDGTVTDNLRNRMWQQESAGPMNWKDAMSYASGLTLGGHSGWRLPDSNELRQLYESSCRDLMDIWRDPPYFWAYPADFSNPDYAWYVSYEWGFWEVRSSIFNRYYVRGVRSTQ